MKGTVCYPCWGIGKCLPIAAASTGAHEDQMFLQGQGSWEIEENIVSLESKTQAPGGLAWPGPGSCSRVRSRQRISVVKSRGLDWDSLVSNGLAFPTQGPGSKPGTHIKNKQTNNTPPQGMVFIILMLGKQKSLSLSLSHIQACSGTQGLSIII